MQEHVFLLSKYGLFSRNSSVIHVSSLMLLRSKKHFRFVTSLNSLGQQVRVIYEYTEGIFFCNSLRLLKVDIERARAQGEFEKYHLKIDVSFILFCNLNDTF